MKWGCSRLRDVDNTLSNIIIIIINIDDFWRQMRGWLGEK
jgi:hypothetical protein